jgi:hypothetical protein
VPADHRQRQHRFCPKPEAAQENARFHGPLFIIHYPLPFFLKILLILIELTAAIPSPTPENRPDGYRLR